MNKELIDNAQAALKEIGYEDRGKFYCNLRFAATMTKPYVALQALIDAARKSNLDTK